MSDTPARRPIIHAIVVGPRHRRDLGDTGEHIRRIAASRRGESVRLVLNKFEGRDILDLRTWYTVDDKLKPGKGFAAEVKHLPRLAAAIAKAEAKARELGLIDSTTTEGISPGDCQ